MSNYRFAIKDYHAIKNADIKINGITVIAGENGSGKSTILRWLNFIVKVLNEYENMVYVEATEQAFRVSYMLDRVINQSLDIYSDERFELYRLLRSNSKWAFSKPDLSEIKSNLEKAILFISNFQKKKEIGHLDDENRKRIFDFLNLSEKRFLNKDPQDITSILKEYIEREFSIIENEIGFQSQQKTYKNFTKYLAKVLDPKVEGKNVTVNFEFYEDKVDLFKDDFFKLPLNLTHSIFHNTDRILKGIDSDYPIDEDTLRWLYTTNPNGGSNARHVIRVIEKIIQGRVVTEENSTHDEELKYKRADGLDIYLQAAATGIISFSYILKFLENGWIDDRTLLIIDEPEAHLHPQWIVEYARMLVLINKYIGAKIVVASHNPDMVSAIQSIATREEVIGNTNFYIAKRLVDKEETSFTYEYEDCGQEIGQIFDSFNIAFDRIAFYGE